MTSPNGSSCNVNFFRFLKSPSTLFLKSLRDHAVQVLLSLSPFFENVAKDNVSSEADLSRDYVFLHIWSPLDPPNSFDPLSVSFDSIRVRSIARRLMEGMKDMGFRGLADICLSISKYQFTTVEMEKKLYRYAIDGVESSEGISAVSSGSSLLAFFAAYTTPAWSLCVAVCVSMSGWQYIYRGAQGLPTSC
ncbi:hypothetical protein ACOMHN_063517 [Nucella lapillus]